MFTTCMFQNLCETFVLQTGKISLPLLLITAMQKKPFLSSAMIKHSASKGARFSILLGRIVYRQALPYERLRP